MGHSHRDRGCGCGGGGCGLCGLGAFGLGGLGYPGYGFPAAAALPAYGGYPAPAYGAPPQMVMTPQGQVMMPAQAAPMAPIAPAAPVVATSGPGLAALAYGPNFATAAMAQYVALRSQAGYPVAALPLPLGFRSKKVHRHQSACVKACPETFFSGKGIFIPHRVAKHFDICSIRVGLSYLPMRNVPAELFSTDRCGVGPGAWIPLPPVMPGQKIVLKVKNRSGSSHRFRGAILGTALL